CADAKDVGKPCTLGSDCSTNTCNTSGDIFNVTTRLDNNTGPVMLDQVTTSIREAFPVNNVQSSLNSVAVARQGDNHVIIRDKATGTETDTGLAAAMAGPKSTL